MQKLPQRPFCASHVWPHGQSVSSAVERQPLRSGSQTSCVQATPSSQTYGVPALQPLSVQISVPLQSRPSSQAPSLSRSGRAARRSRGTPGSAPCRARRTWRPSRPGAWPGRTRTSTRAPGARAATPRTGRTCGSRSTRRRGSRCSNRSSSRRRWRDRPARGSRRSSCSRCGRTGRGSRDHRSRRARRRRCPCRRRTRRPGS